MVALTFIAIAVLHLRLIWVLLVVGGLGALWAYRLLDQPQGAAPEPDPDSGLDPDPDKGQA